MLNSGQDVINWNVFYLPRPLVYSQVETVVWETGCALAKRYGPLKKLSLIRWRGPGGLSHHGPQGLEGVGDSQGIYEEGG